MSEISPTNNGHNPANDRGTQNGGPPIVFMQESSLFGNRKVERNEWLKHSELYGALSNTVDPNHITGLQRVNGMWRIYIDNIEDKVALLNEGVLLRGKRIPLLNTNPNRLDSEQTIRVRIKNIPLSVEDGVITRPLILKGIEVIKSMREKLRYNGKLTNCETGDRLLTVKATTLQTPLPRTMMFGKFIGRIIHTGQNNEPRTPKCRKCLEDGHVAHECQNEWKCLTCLQSGHRKGECDVHEKEDDKRQTQQSEETNTSESARAETSEISENSENKNNEEKKPRKVLNARKKESKKTKKEKKQTLMDTFCSDRNETPNKGRAPSAKNRTPPTPEEELVSDKKKRLASDSDDSECSSSDD
jgi:hypothetical protein